MQSLDTEPATILSSGRLDLPPDVRNGMVLTLLRNLPPGREETVHVVAFTPDPKIVPLRSAPGNTSTVRIGDLAEVTQYILEPKLAWLTALLGKLPSSIIESGC